MNKSDRRAFFVPLGKSTLLPNAPVAPPPELPRPAPASRDFPNALLGYMHVLSNWVEHIPSLPGDANHHLRMGTYLLGSLHKTTEGLELLAKHPSEIQELAMLALRALSEREAVNCAHSLRPELEASLRGRSQKLIDLLARVYLECPGI